jgi:diadenosine tetraphosphate (Ap4A) HIT family hydrolase
MDDNRTRQSACPFCTRIAQKQYTAENRLAVYFTDGFPLNPGHQLIVSKRHVDDYFALGQDEQRALLELTNAAHTRLEAAETAAGYNVGINVGRAAGQTIMHVHVHLIPRFIGDVPDPRGGIRWMIPARAQYWEDA